MKIEIHTLSLSLSHSLSLSLSLPFFLIQYTSIQVQSLFSMVQHNFMVETPKPGSSYWSGYDNYIGREQEIKDYMVLQTIIIL